MLWSWMHEVDYWKMVLHFVHGRWRWHHDFFLSVPCRLKQRGQVADMNTIIEAVNQDWATLVNRMKLSGGGESELRDNVHSALGALIKQRKVYYTGNKGYFLVGPHDNNANGCTGTFFNNNNGSSAMSNKLAAGLGSKFSHLRHSLRERSSSSNGNHSSPGEYIIIIPSNTSEYITVLFRYISSQSQRRRRLAPKVKGANWIGWASTSSASHPSFASCHHFHDPRGRFFELKQYQSEPFVQFRTKSIPPSLQEVVTKSVLQRWLVAAFQKGCGQCIETSKRRRVQRSY